MYTESNHPPAIIRQLPAAINCRISNLLGEIETFNKSKPRCEEVLQFSDYSEKLSYTSCNPTVNRRRSLYRFI